MKDSLQHSTDNSLDSTLFLSQYRAILRLETTFHVFWPPCGSQKTLGSNPLADFES